MIQIGIVALFILGVRSIEYNGTTSGVTSIEYNETNAENRIIGGYYVCYTGKFPYMASLQDHGWHVCGASIIQQQWLLTAAHCVEGEEESGHTVVVGTNTIHSGTGETYEVERFVIYPHYNDFTKDDIALIRTAMPIIYNTNVQPIEMYDAFLGAGQSLRVTGWGRTSSSSSISIKLKYANLQSLSKLWCWWAYFPITGPNHICTSGTSSTGNCNGDAGGPLTYDGKLVGITSFGRENCDVKYANVFTRVVNYIPWIKETIYYFDAELPSEQQF